MTHNANIAMTYNIASKLTYFEIIQDGETITLVPKMAAELHDQLGKYLRFYTEHPDPEPEPRPLKLNEVEP